MRQLLSVASQFRDDETGAAMVEYSILIAIIAGVAILAIIAIGLWPFDLPLRHPRRQDGRQMHCCFRHR